MAGSVVGSIAGGIASKAAGKLFGGGGGGGGDIPMMSSRAAPISLDTKYYAFRPGSDMYYSLTRTGRGDQFFKELRDAKLGAAGEFQGLIDQVRPGFGALTDSRVRSIRDARDSSVSNLRDNLARRRVLGSSFGQDSLTRADAEFAKAESEARAQSVLEEIDLTSRLIKERTAYMIDAAQFEINQANLEFQMASNLIQGTQQTMQSNAGVIAELMAQNAAGSGAFAGQVGGGVEDWLEKQSWWPF